MEAIMESIIVASEINLTSNGHATEKQGPPAHLLLNFQDCGQTHDRLPFVPKHSLVAKLRPQNSAPDREQRSKARIP